jgi:prepilin-type N-terminal cleavage/methylation domain-containing protein
LFLSYTPGMKTRGFTLIEITVVVGIIALAAAIVVATLNSSRYRGANAGIKSNMHTISQQVELFFLNNGNSYGTDFTLGSCAQTTGTLFADTIIWKAIQEITRQSTVTPTCSSTATTWAVSTPLRTSEGSSTYWCIDSQGKAKGESTDITSGACQ